MEEQSNEALWYVVHTYSGYENKVANDLQTMVENRHLQDLICDIKVPVEMVPETVTVKTRAKKGDPDSGKEETKVKMVEHKVYPGYVFVKMVMNDDTWYVVRNTRGVTGFVGPGSKPVPLTEAEMKPLGIKTENVSIDFGEGDSIAVVAGVWKDTVGIVQKLDYGKQTATINVEMFGRETPVEISFAEVRKL